MYESLIGEELERKVGQVVTVQSLDYSKQTEILTDQDLEVEDVASDGNEMWRKRARRLSLKYACGRKVDAHTSARNTRPLRQSSSFFYPYIVHATIRARAELQSPGPITVSE